MKRASEHANWRGGRTVHRGYVYIIVAGHPRANANGYVLEHIVVAEQMLGRPLREDEHVHHLSGDRGDNRPANLQVVTRAQHTRIHCQLYTQEILIAALRWFALKLGHTPRLTDFGPPRFPIRWVSFQRHFGSLSAASRASGLTPNRVGRSSYGGCPLPENFRRQHADLLRYPTAEAMFEGRFGGLLTEHERHLRGTQEVAA
jgi:hypothetical protein